NLHHHDHAIRSSSPHPSPGRASCSSGPSPPQHTHPHGDTPHTPGSLEHWLCQVIIFYPLLKFLIAECFRLLFIDYDLQRRRKIKSRGQPQQDHLRRFIVYKQAGYHDRQPRKEQTKRHYPEIPLTHDLIISCRGLPALINNRIHLLRRQMLPEKFPELHHRRIPTSTQTFYRLQGKHPIRRSLANIDPQFLLDIVDDIVATLYHTRPGLTHLENIPAHRLQIIHRIERRHLIHIDGLQLQERRHIIHDVHTQPAPKFVLRQMQNGQQSTLLLPIRIPRNNLVDLL